MWVISSTKEFIGNKGIETNLLCEYVFIMFEVKILKRRQMQYHIPGIKNRIEMKIPAVKV